MNRNNLISKIECGIKSVDEIAENIKFWNKISEEDIGMIPKYLKSMGFLKIVLVSYNEWTQKLILALKGSDIEIFVCSDVKQDVPIQDTDIFKSILENGYQKNITVCDDILSVLKNEEPDLIIDTDAKQYNLRRFLYDGFHCESCLVYQILEKIYTDERFRWERQNIDNQDKMLQEFFDIIKSRYNSIAVYGNGEITQKFISRLQKIFDYPIEHITSNDIVISESGQKIDIIKYCANEIREILYFGVCKEINFYRMGKKLQVINSNQIFQEIFMNYDLATNLVNKIKEKDIECLCFLYPDFYRLNSILYKKGYPCFIKTPLLINMLNDSRFSQNVKDFFGEYYSEEYIQGILKRPSVIEINGIKKYNEFNTPYYNIVNGHRVTTDCPKNPKRIIHFFGKCATMGRFVEDKNTIASFLQRNINQATDDYQIINYGMEADVEINKKIRNIKFRKGDIVIILYKYYDIYKKMNIPFIDLSELICDIAISNRTYFLDTPEHFNHKVNEKIAMTIYDTLCNDYSVDETVLEDNKYFYIEDNQEENEISNNPEFQKFILDLENEKVKINDKANPKIGAIVMNCNPFTLGHRYLIETAAKQCDILYIFVVQEDKSIFSFKDRFELVKEGTADLKNVKVLPSGSFMISILTFPEYFTKDAPSITEVDPSVDIELFGKYIAPALGITIRFAGEEPIDIITKQYNETMKRILPMYNVEFNVIPRKEIDGEVISASRVRKLLEENNFDDVADKIKKLVPFSTLKYLKNIKK